jgi:glycosyltransferase involved in cell wall biosynthesis
MESERRDHVDDREVASLDNTRRFPNDRSAVPARQPDTIPEVVLSVVMPNYNHARYLSTALKAILEQKVLPDEIVIVDDGSTDDSRSLIEHWMSRESRIRAEFNPSNRGAIASINRGLELARGKYVCLMAADDLAYPSFFSEALEALRNAPDVALCCAEAHVQSMDSPQQKPELRPVIRPSRKFKSFGPRETRRLLRYNDHFVMSIATVFRRDMVLAEGSFDPELGSMADGFLSKHLALKYGFCFIPKVVVRWQVRGDGLSRTNSRDLDAARLMLEKAKKRIELDPVFPTGYSEVFDRRWRFASCRVALAGPVPDWDFLRSFGPRSLIDMNVLAIARKIGSKAGVYLALIWLTLRYRPYSLLALAETYLRRRWDALSWKSMPWRSESCSNTAKAD